MTPMPGFVEGDMGLRRPRTRPPELKLITSTPAWLASCKAGTTASGSAMVLAMASAPSATHWRMAAACSAPVSLITAAQV